MSSQRYERVPGNDREDTPASPQTEKAVPQSPPPSFRSRTSSFTSRHLLSSDDPLTTDADRTLADTFDDGSASDSEEHGNDDRQRLMRGHPTPSAGATSTSGESRPPAPQRAVTQFPGVTPAPATRSGTPFAAFSSSNDGVFANLDAKPERGEKLEEQPPSYEAAAADATPPYWESTLIVAPGSTDEVYVEGLPVGSLFSFVWNAMISMSFQFVGFLLTYLLHTTHAAKNGSRAGLGITLVQYGFYMRAGKEASPAGGADDPYAQPQDPNSHDFDPGAVGGAAAAAMASSTQNAASSTSTIGGIAGSEWLAYALMIVGWFILIRAVGDFFKARRHEQLVLQSPDRGLNVPIVAEGEEAATAV